MPDFSLRNRSSTAACASGVRVVSIVFGQALARERRRLASDTAAPRRAVSPSIADGGTLRYSIGKSDAPVRAIEHEHVAGLGDLRDGVDRAAVAPDGDEARRRRESPSPRRRA